MTKLALSVACRAGELELREFQPSDVTGDYVAWMNDAEVVRYTEQKFRRHTIASVTGFARRMMESEDYCLVGIFHEGRHVGNVGIGPIDWNHRHGEIGYIIGRKEYWNKGVATAAVGAVSDFALEELGLGKVFARCIDGNAASLKVLEKAGFAIEGRLCRHVVLDGERADEFVLGKLAG